MNKYETEDITLIHGDALEELAKLPTGSVDCVLTDPPYGTTNAPWDNAPLWEPLFAQLWRVLKHNGALLMFAQNPLAAELICMQRRYFRYEWVWEKKNAVGFLNASRMPLRAHELVLVFYRALPTYNRAPITGQEGKPYASGTSEHMVPIYGRCVKQKNNQPRRLTRPARCDKMRAGE